MNFHVFFLSSYIIFCAHIAKADDDQDTFPAVTAFPGLARLYRRMKIREPHLDPSSGTDAAAKRRICHSITRSVYFNKQYKEEPIDMNKVYRHLKMQMKIDSKDLGPNRLLQQVLKDFTEEGSFTYRTRLTRFSTDSDDWEEFAFACATKDRDADGRINVYLISDSYNVRIASDIPTVGRTSARFICTIIVSQCRLVALAEEAASAFPTLGVSTMHALENIYQHMKKFHPTAHEVSDDPLCGLTESEKVRVCASVLSAPNFLSKAEYNPDPYTFERKCERKKVSFLLIADEGEEGEEEKGEPYYEWMLYCPVKSLVIGSRTETRYLLSRGYNSHYVYVHSHSPWTQEWYIESIGGNVGAIVENDVSGDPDTYPNLADLLEEKYSTVVGM